MVKYASPASGIDKRVKAPAIKRSDPAGLELASTPRELGLRVGGSPQELSTARAPQELVAVHDDTSARQNGLGHSSHLDAFEHGIVHPHVMVCGTDDVFAAGVENDQICVAANSDRALAWVEAEEFRRSGGNQLHKAVHAKAAGSHPAGVDQAQAVLDAWTAIRDFGEVVTSQFFLFLEAKRTMVSGDHLQVVSLESVPKPFLMPFLSQRRSKDVFRAVETWYIEVLNRKVEILGTSFGVDGQTTVACLAHFLQGIIAAQVHNVDGRSRLFFQGDRP